jgi:steroid delta-isomerase-like uncharacterized protein
VERSKDLAHVADDLIDAINKDDWQRLRASLSPTVVYDEIGTGRRIQGADEYVQLCQAWKQSFPDAAAKIHRTMVSGDTVTQEVTWEGTHSGPLPGPGGPIPPSGKPVSVRTCILLSLAGDQVSELHQYVDVMSMMTQLGAFPAPQ